MSVTILDPADVLPGLPMPVAMATTCALADGAYLVQSHHDLALDGVSLASHAALKAAGFVRLLSGRWVWQEFCRVADFFTGAMTDMPVIGDVVPGAMFVTNQGDTADRVFIASHDDASGVTAWVECRTPQVYLPVGATMRRALSPPWR